MSKIGVTLLECQDKNSTTVDLWRVFRLPFYVYILVCADGTFYTGYTKDVSERARLHACGKGARYTRAHKPERVAYVETWSSRAEAMKREKAIKKLSHQQKVDLVESAQKTGSSDKKRQR